MVHIEVYCREFCDALIMFYDIFPNLRMLFSPSTEKTLLTLPQGAPMENAEIWYYPQFFTIQESDAYFEDLLQNIAWKQDDITIFGKTYKVPRLQAWYGEADKAYYYSGMWLEPTAWTDALLAIKQKIEVATETHYTSVLLNQYRHGQDSVGWHADDEAVQGKNPIIASVSFGATRKFKFRRTDNHALKTEVMLEHGSLVMMRGETQHFWQHEIPKTSKPTSTRLNLTFRKIL
jgi:alkylated DNA repair dioxygenase AlkB